MSIKSFVLRCLLVKKNKILFTMNFDGHYIDHRKPTMPEVKELEKPLIIFQYHGNLI
jgi:hypothetical protein